MFNPALYVLMNNTRMTLTSKKNKKLTLELYQDLIFYHNFLSLFWNFTSYTKFFLFWKKIHKHSLVFNYLRHRLQNNFFPFSLSMHKNKNFNFYNNLKIEYKTNETSLRVANVLTAFSNSRSKTFKIKNFAIFKNFLFFNFLFSFSTLDSFFNCHHDFSLFHFKNTNHGLIVTDLLKFLNRWQNGQNFIFNIYYYNYTPLLFGSFEFKNEILSINWYNSKFEVNFWKYSYTFFIFKNNRFGVKVNHFFNKLNMLDINFIFVSNPFYHKKNLYYFNKLKFFTLAPVASNISPWLVSYPLPVFSVSFLIEFFFLKFLILIERYALCTKYKVLKSNWIQLSTLPNLF